MNIKEIQDIKTQIEQRKQSIERAKGRKEQLLKSLQNDFNCNSLEEAKEVLQQLKNEGQEIKNKIEKLCDKIERIWNDSQGEPEDEFSYYKRKD